tara:strand:+ start:292 stop:1071 length:780 start_codon:yes stop_codon:yes gene_type:complete
MNNKYPTIKDFIQKRLEFCITDHPISNRYHLFKDKLREKVIISQLGCPTATLYKVFESPDDIELSYIPNSFVIKLSFQSLSRGIIKVKNNINLETGNKFNLKESIHYLNKFFKSTIKYQKVIVEELLEPEIPNTSLLDIKVFYLKGEPLFLQCIDPKERPPDRNYLRYHFNTKWERVDIHNQEAPLDKTMKKPKCLEEILKWGKIIANKYFKNTFIRIDFYPTNKGCVFGETTLCPNFDCKENINKKYGAIFFKENIDI